MIFTLKMSSEIPIYQQLRNQIVLGIGRGELQPGESLPTVRQLAEDIGVNNMTVNKAYQMLKAEGYIEIDRRHGAKVAESASNTTAFQAYLQDRIELTAAEAKAHGINAEDYMKICQKAFGI
ncbi:MAG: GntR family transcriptional regulator [Lachnospiraceae bacterium]|nr:GntR family transcriptional regulator [Lachnospiraceae bacterium]